jgi:uncharacterized membrane protein
MDSATTQLESLFGRVESYNSTTHQLSRLRDLESITNVVPKLITRVCVGLVFIFFVLVLNIGIALWLGELLGKSYYGFFIVATIFLVIGVMLFFFLTRWIRKPVGELLFAQMFSNNDKVVTNNGY